MFWNLTLPGKGNR